jgi:blue copper oxidase
MTKTSLPHIRRAAQHYRMLLAPLLLSCGSLLFAQEPSQEAFSRPLPIPPLLTGLRTGNETVYEITARPGSRRFFQEAETPTLGYNGDYLGPTLRFRRGEQVLMVVRNKLPETTTVHWHGLEVPGEADGGPHQVIAAGATWEPRFGVDQPAATLWYHPHPMGRTAEQVYLGLAGMIIIDDEISDSLDLPETYGKNDIPLIIQDRRFRSDGIFSYRLSMPDLMHGLIGATYLVNGEVKPRLSAAAELIRFRLLNGSNSSIYRLSFDDGSAFSQIAGDGGFLEKPVEMSTLILSPGERAEILLDLRRKAPGDSLHLVTETFQGYRDAVLKIVMKDEQPGRGPAAGMPSRLVPVARIPEARAERSRRFDLETMGGGGRLTINGKKMDMERIDARVRAGSTEIWEIVNAGAGMMQIPHSFHVHGVQFQILDINGDKPPDQDSGWKDTVLLWPGDRMRIIIPFREFPGIYMYHCHLLEHEDDGMMGQFEVSP